MDANEREKIGTNSGLLAGTESGGCRKTLIAAKERKGRKEVKYPQITQISVLRRTSAVCDSGARPRVRGLRVSLEGVRFPNGMFLLCRALKG